MLEPQYSRISGARGSPCCSAFSFFPFFLGGGGGSGRRGGELQKE